jgi:transcriptional regulator NrdR family protein
MRELKRKDQTSERLPCPECGAMELRRVVENRRLDDGVSVKRLPHFKCCACGARFFDDGARHRIQAERAKQQVPHAV